MDLRVIFSKIIQMIGEGIEGLLNFLIFSFKTGDSLSKYFFVYDPFF